MSSKEDLRQKLKDKIKQKRLGRSTISQRKQEVDEYAKKLGLSEKDMQALVELSEKMNKNKKTK